MYDCDRKSFQPLLVPKSQSENIIICHVIYALSLTQNGSVLLRFVSDHLTLWYQKVQYRYYQSQPLDTASVFTSTADHENLAFQDTSSPNILLSLPSGRFQARFPTKFLYTFLVFPYPIYTPSLTILSDLFISKFLPDLR